MWFTTCSLQFIVRHLFSKSYVTGKKFFFAFFLIISLFFLNSTFLIPIGKVNGLEIGYFISEKLIVKLVKLFSGKKNSDDYTSIFFNLNLLFTCFKKFSRKTSEDLLNF